MPWSDPWDTLWGGPAAVPTLADTLYYGVDNGGGIADLATDQSQFLDDQATGASWHYELSGGAGRFNIAAPWTIECEIEADNADTGRLYTMGTAATDFLSFRYGQTAGNIEAILTVGGAATEVGQLALPGVSGSLQRFLVAWTAMPNPDRTGASDAVLHTLSAWNLDTAEFDSTTFASVDRAPGANQDVVWWAQTRTGTNPFTGVPHACRFSCWHHTPTESWEEMSGQMVEPTLRGEERFAVDVPPRSSTIGDDGNFAGPVFLLGAAAARQNDLRLASPLVNVVYRSRPEYEGNLSAQNVAWLYEDPDDTDMQLYLAHCHWAPVPPSVNYAHVRMHLRITDAVPDLDMAVYSMSQPGHFYRPPSSPLTMQVFRRTATLAVGHGAGATAGEWVDFGALRIARDLDGGSFFVLGFRGAATDTWRVNALTIDPLFVDTGNGPLGLGG